MLGFWITMAVFIVIVASLVKSARRKDRTSGQMTHEGSGIFGPRNAPPHLRPVEEIRVMPLHLPEPREASPEAGPADAARP